MFGGIDATSSQVIFKVSLSIDFSGGGGELVGRRDPLLFPIKTKLSKQVLSVVLDWRRSADGPVDMSIDSTGRSNLASQWP